MITGYIVERCEDGSDKWLRCNARLCPDLCYKVKELNSPWVNRLIDYFPVKNPHQKCPASPLRSWV